MPALFDKFGIKFLYPDDWPLELSTAEDEAGATVYSPGGAFWSVVIRDGDEDPAELANVAVVAIGDEYTDVDTEPAQETIAGQELVGYDLNFYCLDLTNTAQILRLPPRRPNAAHNLASRGSRIRRRGEDLPRDYNEPALPRVIEHRGC